VLDQKYTQKGRCLLSQSAVYSEKQASFAKLSLSDLGIPGWDEASIRLLQKRVGVKDDGWLGPKTIEAFKTWKRKTTPKETPQNTFPGQVILNGVGHPVPEGIKFVNHLEPNGVPAQLDDTDPRKHTVTQFVLHRGAETKKASENYAQATERVLDAQGFSTTYTMDTDGTIYQHFDPVLRRGRHASSHNVQSDAMDIGGPFSIKYTPAEGQVATAFQIAIGREGDNLPQLKRKASTVKCWDLTPSQKSALIGFLPWYCELRGIPLTACEDWRTFRIGGMGVKDPVTTVTGILAHAQISDPGQRVDGILSLICLRDADTKIVWRTGEDFFKT